MACLNIKRVLCYRGGLLAMVKHGTQAGLRDWIIQRLSAVLLGLCAVGLLAYFLIYPNTYENWSHLLEPVWVKLIGLLCLISLLWHAWIGLWTIGTDYIKPKFLNIGFNLIVLGLLLIYLIWALIILWF